MLLENCKGIAENPGIGKKYEGIVKRLFGLIAGRHIFFYRNANEVEITRILHEQMDVKNRILNLPHQTYDLTL
jgi:toxin ParE1/3/4